MSIRVSGTLQLDGAPLKRTFVQILKNVLGQQFVAAFCITDDQGDFSVRIDPPGFPFNFNIRKMDIRIHCHNSTIRVLESGTPDSKISVDKTMNNGGTMNLNRNNLGDFYEHFKILEQCLDVYDTVWRQFKPYSATTRGAFPLKKASTVRGSFSDADFVELNYPATVLGLAYVEPASPTNGSFPLINVQSQTEDYRLFGINGSHPVLLPHELGHAFHFSALTATDRISIEADYVAAILGSLAAGEGGTHAINKRTSPFVAYIEAVGIFSERFYFFKKLVRPTLRGEILRRVFCNDELSTQSLATSMQIDHYESVGTLNSAGRLSANALRGKDIEGSVYAAIYVHLAKKIGLRTVVGFVMDSHATTFDELKAFIVRRGTAIQIAAVAEVESTWFL